MLYGVPIFGFNVYIIACPDLFLFFSATITHTTYCSRCGYLQVKSELTAVEKADMNGQPIEDSFARVGYAKDAEYAVNEQVKYEPAHVPS